MEAARTPAPIIGVAEHYAQFLKLARGRITELGVSYENIDEICGFPARYTSKLLSQSKTMSVFSFFTLARALALLPSFAHDETQLELLHRHPEWFKYRRTAARFRSRPGGAIKFNNYRDFYRQIGRKGAKMAHAKRKLKKRRIEAARIAANARWSKTGAIPAIARSGVG